MRRLIAFPCGEAELAGSLDAGEGRIGLVMVTGGSQTRIGSHRMYERLSKALVEKGYSCLRFDRRGVGDSAGEDPGFEGSEPDITAAVAALYDACPALERVYGFGLCDGGTALALHGLAAGLDGVILVNPWLVETEADSPAPAAIRAHYRKRLMSLEGWKKIVSGAVDYRKLLRSVRSATASRRHSSLAEKAAFGLTIGVYPVWLIVADGDATAIAALDQIANAELGFPIEGRETIRSDSHTFARAGDEAALATATVRALKAIDR